MSYVDHAQITVALPTLGCKANRYDSDTLARALRARGYVIVPPHAAADIVIVNTCTVTGGADAKSRKLLRRATREHARAIVIVTGCYASLAPAQLADIVGVAAVVPISEQPRIPDLLERLCPPRRALLDASAPALAGLSASIKRTRATIKVQDGCNLHCAFCAVTLARGEVRSRPINEVLPELRGVLANGVREIVLTGIRLDAYGLDLPPGQRLADLLDATHALAIPRLRLSSLEPLGINARLAARLAAHPGLCHHFHVCLQSGDDGVLRAMRRGYTTAFYRRAIGQLRAAMPDATFTTDVIVGFPGETEEAFANTCRLLEEIGFIKLHIFPFSPRPGTEAAAMAGHVPDAIKEERSRTLVMLERTLFQRHAQQLVGTNVSVLVEKTGQRGNGLTPHYFRVDAPFPPGAHGSQRSVRVTGYGEDHLLGVEVIDGTM
jgi:threonylcarbamoyladenosine tRNA methylthiotransferase MtaB